MPRIGFSSAVGQLMHISRERLVKKLTVRLDGKACSFRKSAIFPNDEIIGLILRDGLIGSGAFRDGVLIVDGPNHCFSYQNNAK